MMRPVTVAVPPIAADGLAYTIIGPPDNRHVRLTWNDNSITETAFVVQRTKNGITWTDVGTIPVPLDVPNIHEPRFFNDLSSDAPAAYLYRVVAKNTVGYGGAFPAMTVQSYSANLPVSVPPLGPAAPTNLTAVLQVGPQVRVRWRDNATNEVNFVIERSTDGGPYIQVGLAPAAANSGSTVTFIDPNVPTGVTHTYRVAAVNLAAWSAYSNQAAVAVPAAPNAPGSFTAVNGLNAGATRSVVLTWADLSSNETGFSIQRARNIGFTSNANTVTVAANETTLTQTGLLAGTNYYYRIRANNGNFVSSPWVNVTPLPIRTNPLVAKRAKR